MSAKSRGSNAELRIIKQLEAEGYLCCKSGASLGLYDIICIREDGIRLIQSKYGSSRLKRKEREAIVAHRVPNNCTKEYWLLKKRSKPIIEYL